MCKVGLFSVGLDTYWDQFKSLYSNLNGYHRQIKVRLENLGAEVVDAGMVDNTDKSVIAADLFN